MFKLPNINFNKCSFIDGETLEFHFNKHHRAYIDNLNKLSERIGLDGMIDIIEKGQGALRNNAAQSFNHTFYWLGLTPSKATMSNEIANRISVNFGTVEKLEELFLNSAISLFGSGWTWLVLDRKSNKMEVINTQNADVVDFKKYMPLLICDVWEHAYYIDYRNSRANYLKDFWSSINWSFVEENLNAKDLRKIELTMRE